MICNGCGGVLGRDCFNPRECEQISQENNQSDEVRHLMQKIEQLEAEKEELFRHVEIALRTYKLMAVYQPDAMVLYIDDTEKIIEKHKQ